MQTRRSFIRNLALTSSLLYGANAFALNQTQQSAAKASTGKQINIALIGKGGMGTSNTNTSLRVDGVRLVAVCDLFERRLNDARNQWGSHIKTTKEYKEILANKDVDAVIIATPDHWHQQIAIEAMDAGKHVYCEKPVIHKIDEGKALIEAQSRNNICFQVGSQGMSSLGNRAAKLLIQSGVIGEVNFIDGQFTASPGSLNSFVCPSDANEETIWWDKFLGNAPKRSFEPQRFFAWRNWRDYGTGIAGDLFVHVLSSVHYIMDAVGPTKVYTTGDIHHYKDGSRDTPDVMLGYFDYPNVSKRGSFTVQLGANYVNGVNKKWGSTDFEIIGSKGGLRVGWNQVRLTTTYDVDASQFSSLRELGQGIDIPNMISKREVVFEVDKSYKGGHFDHHNSFINSIRNDVPLVANSLFAVRTAIPALLSYESYIRNQAIRWNPETFSEII